MVDDISAAAVLRLLPTRPRVLALGEPTHWQDDLLWARNDLFTRLIEEEGYRAVGMESDCLRGVLVDDYVTTGAGDLDDVMARGFSHNLGAGAGNRALVEWMREFNAGRPAPDRVRFAGLDGAQEISYGESPRQVLRDLHAYLATQVDAALLPCAAETIDTLCGEDARWTDEAAVMEPARSFGRSPEARELRLIADDLLALLEAHTPGLTGDVDRARLWGRAATALLRYHHWMADPTPARMPRLLGVRAAIIAANILALAARVPTLVHTHNLHLRRGASRMTFGGMDLEWWSSGALVEAHLGADYAFVAGALGTLREHGVGEPPADTIEGQLYALPGERLVVDPRSLKAEAARPQDWFGYFPLEPAHLSGFDGILWVRDCRQGDHIDAE